MSVGSRIGSTGLQKGQADNNYLNESLNLSDLDDVATARTNLGVYSTSEVDNTFLKLDQSTAQTLTASPIFSGFTNYSIPFFYDGKLDQNNARFSWNDATSQLYAWTISTTALYATGWTEDWVLYAGAGGLMSGENAFTYDPDTNTLNVDNLTLTNSPVIGGIALNATASGASGCDLVGIDALSGATYDSQCDFNKLFGSAGRASGGTISDAGSETVNVTAGTGFIKATDSDTATLLSFDWAASNGIAIPTNSTRFIGVIYGDPPVVDIRDTQDWDLDTEFPLGSVINLNGTLYILNNPWWVTDGTTNLIEKSIGLGGYLARDQFVGGLILGVTGTRNPTMTAGTVWGRTTEFEMSAIDYSTPTGSFYLYWFESDGTVHEETNAGAGYTQYPVTQWNDIDNDQLDNLLPNKYANWWVFLNITNNELSFIYPSQYYSSSAEAEAETIPSHIPGDWYLEGIIIGKIIFKTSTDAPVEVQSAFVTTFGAAQAADHGNLSGLSDDDHTQYLLADGTRDGASSQAQTFLNNLIVSKNQAALTEFRLQNNDQTGTEHMGLTFYDGASKEASLEKNNNDDSLTINNTGGNLVISTTTAGDLYLSPAGEILCGANNITTTGEISVGDILHSTTNTANYFWMADGTNYSPTSPADARTGLGLISGGTGDIWVEKTGDTMTGALLINGSVETDVQLTVQGAASQSANLFEANDSSGNNLTVINSDGDIILDNQTASSSPRLLIGPNAAGLPYTYINSVHNNASVDAGTTFHRFVVRKTFGATTSSHSLTGLFASIDMDDSDSTINNLRGMYGESKISSGTVSNDLNGCLYTANLDGGTVSEDAVGFFVIVDQEAANTVGGDIYGVQIRVDADGTVNGSSYLLYLEEYSNVDYGIYQDGTAPNVLGGTLRVNDKVIFTQTDGNEYIDSLADGYLDLAATTQIRLTSASTRVTGDLYVGNNADADPAIVFDGDTNDGQITYNEDEDTFTFSSMMITPSEAPDADYEVANKKYVDDNANNADGWISVGACTYASGTTFTLSGDVTDRFNKGTKIKLTQPTDGVKYFYCAGSSESGGTTTVTVYANDEYDLDNEAITSPYVSQSASPDGFPHWFSYTPSFGGFSSDPSSVAAKYAVIGETCFVNIYMGGDGTSNATNLTVTLPINYVGGSLGNIVAQQGRDNSGAVTTCPLIHITNSSTTMTIYKDQSTAGWTSSGGKRVVFITGSYNI